MKQKSQLRLTDDLVFYFVYASDTDASRHALMAMLNLVLDRKDDPITEVTVLNSVHKGFKPSDKGTIMDIRAKTHDGEQFNVEMQNKVQDGFENRILLYGCRMTNSSLDSGENYDKMKKNVVISFVNGIQFSHIPDFHTRFIMAEDTYGYPLTDKLEIHFLELGKLQAQDPSLMSPLEQFCSYIKYVGDDQKEDYVAKLLETDEEAIHMSDRVYKNVTDDEVLEVLLWHEEMAKHDRTTERDAARREGLAEGKAEGIAEGIEQGIAALILDNLEEGKTQVQILSKLQKHFSLTEDKAQEYYLKYSKTY